MSKKMVVVNLYGGPGSGKSTYSAYLFYKLKSSGVNCELVREFAKELVWQENYDDLGNQMYVTGVQAKRIRDLENKVSVVITDSPLNLGKIYGFGVGDLIDIENSRYRNIEIFVERNKDYNTKGRIQNEEEAKALDLTILSLFDFNYKAKTENDFDIIVEDIRGLLDEQIR